MRRGGSKDEAPDQGMEPLFPRLHVNDTVKGGPRAPPRNKMALYEQFSVPSHRFTATAPEPAPPWQPYRPTAGPGGGGTSAMPSPSASQVGGNDRPLFPSFCVPSTEHVRFSDHKNTNSNGRVGNASRAESGTKPTQLKSNDTYAAGPTAGCTSQHKENNIQNSSGKKLTNADDFTVPSVLYSGMPPDSAQENVRIQGKFVPCPNTSLYKSGSVMSKSSSKCSNADRRHLRGMIVSDAKSRESPNIKEKEPAKAMRELEIEERTSSSQISKEKLGRPDTNVSLYRDSLSNLNYADKNHSDIEGYQAKRRNKNAVKTQKNPPKNGTLPSSRPYTDMEHNGSSNFVEHGSREAGEKRKRSHQDVEQKNDLSDSSVESVPELEISPDDVVSAIGPKHFWKARRAIVNQQRVFAVQVFELHRLIKVQKSIAASPHLLIEGDPCLGKAFVASKKKLAGGDMEKQLPSSKNMDDVQPTLQRQEYSKDNTDENQPSPSGDDVAGVQHDGQGTTNVAVSSNPPAMPTSSENKLSSWCVPPPANQWLVPVMSPSEGLVYKPYTGPCPPAGSFLAPFYAGCAPVSLPSTAGDFMNSAYGIPMPHQAQHMGVPGPPHMPPMYFPPFSMPVNPTATASAVEQLRHVAAWPNGYREQHSRSSCNMSHLRSEAPSAGIRRFHASRDSELQGSSASSPVDRQQGDGRGPAPLLAGPSGGNGQPQPLSGSRDNTGDIIRVVPHTARTASESAARIFQSIQMERQQSDL